MAAGGNRGGTLDQRGIASLEPQVALAVLGGILDRDVPHAVVVKARWPELTRRYRRLPSLLRRLANGDGGGPGDTAPPTDDPLLGELRQVDGAARRAILVRFFLEQLTKIMGLDPKSVDVEQPLSALGLDSLMAIELKNIVETKLRVAIPVARFMEGPSVARLSEVVGELLEGSAPALPTLDSSQEVGDVRYPLSERQKALWFLYKLAPQSTAYNICDAVTAHGPLDLAALQTALQAIVDRHSSFRTTFHDEAGVPYQQVHRVWPVSIQVVDASAWSETELRRRIGVEVHTPFDLEVGPLLRVTVLRCSPQRAVLVFAVHHLIADFWSMVACTDEFRRLYAAARLGEPAELPPILHQYSDFLRWQRELLDGDEGRRQWRYWSEQLAGDLPILHLPTDRPYPTLQSFRGSLAFHKLDPQLTAELKRLAEANGATLNMVLLATYLIVLHRYAGQDDVLVGLPTSGRTRAEFATPVGYFVNPVVVRGKFDDDPTLLDFLRQVRERTLGAIEHQDFPLPLLVDRLKPPRVPGRSTLFQSLFVMQKAQILHEQGLTPFLMGQSGAKLPIADLTFESMTLEQWVAQFDLSLAASEADGGTSLGLQYSTDLFERDTAERYLESFTAVARSFVSDPRQQVSQVPLLSTAEEQRLLALGSAARVARNELPVHVAVERQAARTPRRRAVVAGDGSLTYEELNRRANQLAHCLKKRGVGRGDRVGICLPRGVDLPIALLGVLKSGAAYVPLDATYPESRLSLIAADAGLSYLATLENLAPRLKQVRCPILMLDTERDELARERSDDPPPVATPDDLIYVIFTSGSTGVPKGAGVYHRGFSNLAAWYLDELEIGTDDRTLVMTSHGFDLTQKNLYAVLMTGGTLCLSATTVYDPDEIAAEVERFGVTIVNCTPSNFYGVVESTGDVDAKLRTLRHVVLGGEPIDVARLKPWVERAACRAEITNSYGPTECSDVVSFHRLAGLARYAGRTVPIGAAVPGCRLYILDRRRRLVPQGVAGELHVGGICVGAGYVNDPQRTNDRFMPDPFGEAGARMYATGDLCRLTCDGTIEFLGRNDHQVKIRGYRIELGEIEAALTSTGLVREAVAVVHEAADGAKRLAAYVVPTESLPSDVEIEGRASDRRSSLIVELMTKLGRFLPDYMIPSVIIPLEGLPLTPHGKVDRAALPEIGAHDARAVDFEEPATDTERLVAEIWSEVLKVPRVGRRDGFFELGGDSLSTIQVVSRLNARGLRCRPAVMFQCRTVADLARAIDATAPAEAPMIDAETNEGPLLPMQSWFFAENFAEPDHYNQSVLIEVPPDLNVDALRAAIDAVALRHPTLRTAFARRDGVWRQQVVPLPDCAERLTVVDLFSHPTSAARSTAVARATEAQRSLCIEKGLLWKGVLFDHGGESPGRLLLIAHHLAVDPYSWTILLSDLAHAYGQATSAAPIELPPAGITPVDYARRRLDGSMSSSDDVVSKQRASTFPRRAADTDTFELRRQLVDETEIDAGNVEPAVLLAAVGQAIQRCFSPARIVVDWEAHGRDREPEIDLSRTVGWFVVWKRIEISPANGSVRTIQSQLDSPDAAEGSHHSDVRINYLGALLDSATDRDAPFRVLDDDRGPEQSPQAHRPHALELDAAVVGRRMRMTWTYGSASHSAASIERLAKECSAALQALLRSRVDA